MYLICFNIIITFIFLTELKAKNNNDIPCQWKSLTGDEYNLQQLIIPSDGKDYFIIDGDIPCTPETEPSYSYMWNICSVVNNASLPHVCWPNKVGSVVQYLIREANDVETAYQECNVVGRYDELNDDTHYKLIDNSDPTIGISMTYKSGDKCPKNVLRSATIEIYCKNVESVILSVNEPSYCQYHLSMESYYGCPTGCPVTENGLCNSHGHCSYDDVNRQSYCYCNTGYGGADCSPTSSKSTKTYAGLSAQVGLMITLLIITLLLLGVIGYMVYRITEDRKAQALLYEQTSTSSSHGIELSSHDFH
eukprot:gene17841-23453_t